MERYENGSYRQRGEVVDWIHVVQRRDQWQATANSNEPSDSMKGCEFLD